MAPKAEVAFGPFYVYCSPSLSGASVAMVDIQNLHPQGCPFEEGLLGSQI